MWFLGVAWVPRPFVLTASSCGTLALAVSQGTSSEVSRPYWQDTVFWARIFYIDIPFHYHLFAFNLYPIALKCSANVLHKFCAISFMQSAFTIRNMDSTLEPPSPNMAAADPKQRKLRKCTNCTSRMPSFFYDNHTLCTKCRNQVCDMQLVCDECRDWPVTKRKIFVNYNHKLRTKRESKRRQARLASAASDQSVCDTDTDVPLDEPSVPVQDMHLDELNLGQEQCLISEEVVVSAGPSTETTTSNLLLLPPGSDLDKLAFTVLSRLSDLQSARGPKPQFRVNQCQLDLASRLLFCLMSVSLQFRILQQEVPLVSRVLFCLMSVNLQFRQRMELVNRELFCLMSANLFLLITRLRGSRPPLQYLLTLPNQFSGSPQHPHQEGSNMRRPRTLGTLSPTRKGSTPCSKPSPPFIRRLHRLQLAA